MTRHTKFMAVLAGTTAATVVLAPAVQARPTCRSAGVTSTICETNGSVNIKARPGTTAPPASQPAYPWLGRGLPGVG